MRPTRFSKLRYTLLIGLVVIIYFLDSYFNNILISFVWLGIGLLVWFFPAVRPKGKLKIRGSLNFWAFCFAFIIIVVQVLAGIFDGLGRSPYDHSVMGIIFNTMTVSTALIGRELTRHYLVNSITRREESLKIFIGVSIFLTLVAFPFMKYTGFKGYEETVKFLAQFFMPEFANNLLATYLAFYGGPITSMIFMGTIKVFHWLSPILPNLKWITAALVGILTPIFLLSFLENIYQEEARISKLKDKKEENPVSWIITTLTSIGIIWFSVGVFPIYPSVIATGSMIPMIQPGDIVLVDKKIDANKLLEGQVIQFKRDNILISHRVIDIVETNGEKSYRTKGDNNSGADPELVKLQDIKGTIIKVVPKLGWPTLLIKSRNGVSLDKIQF